MSTKNPRATEWRRQAAKARRLAENVDRLDVAVRLRGYAKELEARAEAEEAALKDESRK